MAKSSAMLSKNLKQKVSFIGNRKPPLVPLHGVDFSGSSENKGRNNKIWIASWYPGEKFVSFKCGGDAQGFGRRDLADFILCWGGLWVIDFPFGPPEKVAEAAGWRSWQEYLAWCCSDFDPTDLRNDLRITLRSAGVKWSTKRKIDQNKNTTWFPFFQQLYRQTITGGRDVLSRLNAVDRELVSVFPFHDRVVPTCQRSVVVEGFPGWTLSQMGLLPIGYKKSTTAACKKRAAIIDVLTQSGIPICEDDIKRAVADNGGDGIDALVLLNAAWNMLGRNPLNWISDDRSSIEGWFFD